MGDFSTWPEAVQLLLQTYARDEYLEEAVAALNRLVQKNGESEHDFARSLTQAARKCAGVFSRQALITIFLQGVPKTVLPVLRLQRKNFQSSDAFSGFVGTAAAHGSMASGCTLLGKGGTAPTT